MFAAIAPLLRVTCKERASIASNGSWESETFLVVVRGAQRARWQDAGVLPAHLAVRGTANSLLSCLQRSAEARLPKFTARST